MHETDDDVAALQALLERSAARMSPYMRSILTPDRRLSAQQVVAYLQGVKHVALATVAARGEPRVSPMDALFVRGRFHAASGGAAARVEHLRRDPAVSLTHFVGEDIAITVHGRALLLARDHAEVPVVEKLYVDVYGSSPFDWADDVVLIRVEPDVMYASAPDPTKFADGTPAAARTRPRPVLVRKS